MILSDGLTLIPLQHREKKGNLTVVRMTAEEEDANVVWELLFSKVFTIPKYEHKIRRPILNRGSTTNCREMAGISIF